MWTVEKAGQSSRARRWKAEKRSRVRRKKLQLHCTLISFTILIPASQPVWPAGRFSTLWPAGRFRVIWPAGRFGVIWPAGRFGVIWPAGRFRKIWPAAGFCSKRSASVHTLHMSRPVMTFVFKVLRNALLRYILYTCPNLWWRSCSKCYAMDCFGTYFTHVQT